MSLTGRFSFLFLTLLALILAGFSLAHYFEARRYFDRRVNERLTAALAVLAAATEWNSEGVEWEPQERLLPVGQDPGDDQIRWMVLDDCGRRIDQSRNLTEDLLGVLARSAAGSSTEVPDEIEDRLGRPWRVRRRRYSGSDAVSETRMGVTEDQAKAGEAHYDALTLTVFAPLGPAREALASLRWSLMVGGVGFWMLAAVLCRWVSRMALAPLTRMAESARGLDASDAGWSLETAGTRDELDALGQAFNDLLGRLHLAYERQRRFSADASHQLRTPLTVLIGQIEVALRRDRPAEEYRRVLGSALGRAMQLRQIVEALLFLNRAEGEAALPAGEMLSLGRWVSDHLNMRNAGEGGCPVMARLLETDDPVVRGHSALLDQLLANLLENAEKYGKSGAPIVVETSRDGDWAVLAVEDSGPGIPEEDRSRVFEPFYRSIQARYEGIPGVGLGLAIVQRIAQAFGGGVRVGNRPGAGCRVEVRLPISIHTAT